MMRLLRPLAATVLAVVLTVPGAAASTTGSLSITLTSARAFSPNGDGTQDALMANVRASLGGPVTIEVRDYDGQVVAMLLDAPLAAGETSAVRWDGQGVPDGPYVLVGRAGAATTTVAFARWSTLPRLHDPSGMVVVLDAGHGGTDSGGGGGILADGTVINEKAMNLDIALRTRAMLTAAGITVVMTRTTDKTISIGDRTRLSNNSRADVYVAIHNNSIAHHGAQTEAFYCGTGCIAPGTSRALANSVLGAEIAQLRGMESATYAVSALRLTALDDYIEWTQIRTCPSMDKVMGCHYGFLGPYSKTYRPQAVLAAAALMETLSGSNPVELAMLATPSVRTALSVGYAEGIGRYLAGRPIAVRLALAAGLPALRAYRQSTVSVRLTNTGSTSIPAGSLVVVGDRSRVSGVDPTGTLGTTIGTVRMARSLAPGRSVIVRVAVTPRARFSRTFKIDLIVSGTRITRLRQPGLQIPAYVR